VRQVEVEKRIFDAISPVYKVDVKEIAQSLHFDFDENKHIIIFGNLDNITEDEAKFYLITTITWLEHINYKKSILQALLSVKKLELERIKSEKFFEEKNKAIEEGKKATKSELEIKVFSDKEVLSMEEKIGIYSAYLNYLSGLYDVLELFHYSIKHLQANTNNIQNKYGSF